MQSIPIHTTLYGPRVRGRASANNMDPVVVLFTPHDGSRGLRLSRELAYGRISASTLPLAPPRLQGAQVPRALARGVNNALV